MFDLLSGGWSDFLSSTCLKKSIRVTLVRAPERLHCNNHAQVVVSRPLGYSLWSLVLDHLLIQFGSSVRPASDR